MKTIEILLPAMGEGITDATITRWMVAEGDMIDEDQPIVEIATDKVDSEIPSPVKGRIAKLLFQAGDVPKVGQALALVEVEGVEENNNKPEIETPVKKESKIVVEKRESRYRKKPKLIRMHLSPLPLLEV